MSDITKKIYMNASEQGWKYTAVKSEDTIQEFVNVELLKDWIDNNMEVMLNAVDAKDLKQFINED